MHSLLLGLSLPVPSKIAFLHCWSAKAINPPYCNALGLLDLSNNSPLYRMYTTMVKRGCSHPCASDVSKGVEGIGQEGAGWPRSGQCHKPSCLWHWCLHSVTFGHPK